MAHDGRAAAPPTHALVNEVRALSSAFTFLTRIPAWRWIANDSADLPRGSAYFPLVGALVGSVGAVVLLLGLRWWTPLVAVTLSMIATVRLTGAFHEDALADALDGFGGGWTREQVLHIMKDSRVGSYALVGMCLALLLKGAALVQLVAAPWVASDVPLVARALIAAHTLGRCASVWLMAALPYVRVDHAAAGAEGRTRESAGRPFAEGVTRRRVVVATMCTLAVVFVCLGQHTMWAMAAAVIVTAWAGRYFRRRIGGITGDALGAVNQLVEVVLYLLLAALAGAASGQPQ